MIPNSYLMELRALRDTLICLRDLLRDAAKKNETIDYNVALREIDAVALRAHAVWIVGAQSASGNDYSEFISLKAQIQNMAVECRTAIGK